MLNDIIGDNLLLNGVYRDNDPTDVFDADYIVQTRSKQEEVCVADLLLVLYVRVVKIVIVVDIYLVFGTVMY